MGVERYVVEAVVLEGRSHRDVARSAGVSKAWVTWSPATAPVATRP